MESAEITPAGEIDFAAGIEGSPLVLDGLNDADHDGKADFPLLWQVGQVRGGLGRGFDFGTRYSMPLSLALDVRKQVVATDHLFVAVATELQFQGSRPAFGARVPVGWRVGKTELVLTPRLWSTLESKDNLASGFVGGTASLRIPVADWFLVPEATLVTSAYPERPTPLWPTVGLGIGHRLQP